MVHVERTTEIELELENKPGTLADVTERIADVGVNIQGFTCVAQGDKGTACFITSDPDAASQALADAGFQPRTRDVVWAQAPNEPGQLAQLTRRLSESGINIDRSYVTTDESGNVGIEFQVDNPDQAVKVLQG